jgi:hypothetical protein
MVEAEMIVFALPLAALGGAIRGVTAASMKFAHGLAGIRVLGPRPDPDAVKIFGVEFHRAELC